MDFSQFAGLEETGYAEKTPKSPENEMFHSCYIGGQTRENESGVEEEAGKLQIRGVSYNHDKVYMIVTHVKEILVKEGKNDKGWNTLECFSYKNGPPPWKGFAHGPCGRNSAERAADPFCATCKAQILMAGILTDKNGKPQTDEDNKPVFIFIRGKGTKYGNVADYLGELSKMDLSPVFKPVTEKSTKFEKSVVNKMRFVTNVGIGTTKTRYGIKQVFSFETGKELPIEVVQKLLTVANDTLEEFNEKFDWTRGRDSHTGTGPAISGYENKGKLDESQKFGNPDDDGDNEPVKESGGDDSFTSFDDLNFNF